MRTMRKRGLPRPIGVLWALLGCSIAVGQTCGTAPNTANDKIKYAMYFHSKPQDAAQCSMRVVAAHTVFDDPITNPAMSCPDMFSWKLFADVVQQEFWKGWAADQETWPGVQCPNGDPACKVTAPLPLCRQNKNASECCDPNGEANPGYDDPNYPFKFCPYFPGDHQKSKGLELRRAAPPSKAHLPAFAEGPRFANMLMALNEPGRDIRQTMAELVFRNKPMWDYTFRNNLYNQEGLIRVFQSNSANITRQGAGGPPYRLENGATAISEIDYPVRSIMIKSNWLSEADALRLHIEDVPQHIKMDIDAPYTNNNGTVWRKGRYWLVAFHISSKDTPNWVWSTFEHVANPGRCDFTGCNDSYGFFSVDASVAADQAKNYTSPHTKCDDLPLPAFLFDNGNQYQSGPASAGLAAVFRDLKIGTTDNSTGVPKYSDRAWLNYRLKGSQIAFTDSMGNPTHLGNSITEGGFVSSSSCITCHARAGAAAAGSVPPALGVFVNEVEDSGYFRSAHGVPSPDWYYRSATPASLSVLQTDFVWGFLAANCITQNCSSAGISAAPTVEMQMLQERSQSVPKPAPTVRERTEAH